jgi:hypothetical protein
VWQRAARPWSPATWRKLELADGLNRMLYMLASNGVRRQHGEASPGQVRRQMAELWLGPSLVARVDEARLQRSDLSEGGSVATDVLAVTLLVIDELEALGIPYALGGSLASSAHGVPRSTMDAAIVADVREEHVEPLVRALSRVFYVDAEAVRDAIRQRSSFNLIHLQAMLKVDIFIPKRRPFDVAQLTRRVPEIAVTEPERTIFVTSPEDTVLAKLEWYRAGGEVSDRQWSDILGILKVQAPLVDRAYLRHWAPTLGVADLVERALADAGLT